MAGIVYLLITSPGSITWLKFHPGLLGSDVSALINILEHFKSGASGLCL
jgi:hypothetical protein